MAGYERSTMSRELFSEDPKSGDRMHKQGWLRVDCIIQLFSRPFPRNLGKGDPQSLIRPNEQFGGGVKRSR
jgi:hypothetical protein